MTTICFALPLRPLPSPAPEPSLYAGHPLERRPDPLDPTSAAQTQAHRFGLVQALGQPPGPQPDNRLRPGAHLQARTAGATGLGRSRVAAVLAVCSMLAATSAASVASPASAAGQACAELRDATTRLACFDRAFPGSEVQAPRSQATQKGPDPVPEPASAASAFGLAQPAAPKPEPAQLVATVTRIERSARGQRIFTLGNGQRWQQADPSQLAHVNEGAAVVIEKASFGSFRLVTPAGAGLRVRRLR